MSDSVAHYPLGSKISDDASDGMLGRVWQYPDADYAATTRVKPQLSGATVYARLMKMKTGASTISDARGLAVKYSDAPTEFDSVAGAGEVPCGIIDPYLPSGTDVKANEKVMVLFKGPADALSNATLAANIAIKPASGGKYATGATWDESVYGRTIEASTGADQLKRVLLHCLDHQ